MQLSHYSDADSIVPHSTNTEEHADRWTRHDKPFGFWVSVDGPDDWPSWNRMEEFIDTDRQNHFQVTLAADANILHLQTLISVLDFTDEYGDSWSDYSSDYRHCIDWKRVVAAYQGIIIAPYQWYLRHDPEAAWYWGWDVASGCIWSKEAISDVSLVEPALDRSVLH